MKSRLVHTSLKGFSPSRTPCRPHPCSPGTRGLWSLEPHRGAEEVKRAFPSPLLKLEGPPIFSTHFHPVFDRLLKQDPYGEAAASSTAGNLLAETKSLLGK